MKKLFSVFVLICLSFSATAFAGTNTRVEAEHYSAPTTGLTVKYFAYGRPTISEYLNCKARVAATLTKFLDAGYKPNLDSFEVGITESPMSGGNVIVEGGGKIFVAFTATDDELEGKLFLLFSVPGVNEGDISFLPKSQMTIAQFKAAKLKVDQALVRFAQNHLKLVLPANYKILVVTYRTNNRALSSWGEDKTYLYYEATDEEIERYFIRFVQE